MATSTAESPIVAEHVALLRYLYQDVSRISEVSSKDIILHPADRDLSSPPKPPIRGVAAVQAHEEALIAATGGSLIMDVENITASEYFGTVLGTLRASMLGRNDVAVPFCGVWKFRDNRAVEHWENAADAAKLGAWLAGIDT